jgi:16S rRNA (cytidine1402-2'-O)-methyltransferase
VPSLIGDLAPGLYLVATPIGNLEDITLRALRILKEADLIACEDTRQSQKLLDHFGIATRTTSYHEHNETDKSRELVAQLASGARIALITDAGMPGISDPGYRVVTLAIENGHAVIPVPGVSASIAALSASGLPTDAFTFRGFLPSKQGQRRDALEEIRNAEITQIFYETPHRLLEAVQDVAEILGPERKAVVARELTKIHEEFLRGPAGEILRTLTDRGNIKGEIVLLIGKAEARSLKSDGGSVSVRGRVERLMSAENLDEKAALKRVAKELGISKSEAYREWQRKR